MLKISALLIFILQSNYDTGDQGPVSISDKTYFCKISESLETTRFVFRIVW